VASFETLVKTGVTEVIGVQAEAAIILDGSAGQE